MIKIFIDSVMTPLKRLLATPPNLVEAHSVLTSKRSEAMSQKKALGNMSPGPIYLLMVETEDHELYDFVA
jgi:hypothetical protein